MHTSCNNEFYCIFQFLVIASKVCKIRMQLNNFKISRSYIDMQAKARLAGMRADDCHKINSSSANLHCIAESIIMCILAPSVQHQHVTLFYNGMCCVYRHFLCSLFLLCVCVWKNLVFMLLLSYNVNNINFNNIRTRTC